MSINTHIFYISVLITLITPFIAFKDARGIVKDVLFDSYGDIILTSSTVLIIHFIFSVIFSCFITCPILKFILIKERVYTDIQSQQNERRIKTLCLDNETISPQELMTEKLYIGASTGSYYYFTEDENGRYTMEKADANHTYIKETNSINSKIITYEEKEVVITEVKPTIIGKLLGLKQDTTENVVSEKIENTIYIYQWAV